MMRKLLFLLFSLFVMQSVCATAPYCISTVEQIVSYFFVETVDDEIVIPEGEYLINSSLSVGTVLASEGANDDNTVSPSLYATWSDGYLENMYFLVDGRVDVKNKDGQLYVELFGVNSYDLPVHVVYDATTTSVETVPSGHENKRKLLRSNRLVVVIDGKEYDVMGMRL